MYDEMTEYLTDWLNEWWINWMIVDWKSDWVASTNCLTEIDMEWLADYIFLSKWPLTDCQMELLFNQRIPMANLW